MLSGRNVARLEALAADLANGKRAVEIVPADLSREDEVHALIARADGWGVDLVVNNAGVGRLGRVVDNPPEVERDTVAVNVLATVLLTRGLLPGMVQRARAAGTRAGLIIVASTAAFTAVPFFATYAASKAFDLAFTEALVEEMRGEPVDILALCPGATRTALGERAGLAGVGIPGAASPDVVARDGLSALGRVAVKVTGTLDEAVLGPAVLPRRVLSGVLGVGMRLINARWGRGAGDVSSP
jgi:short-subunit dehydrogenase